MSPSGAWFWTDDLEDHEEEEDEDFLAEVAEEERRQVGGTGWTRLEKPEARAPHCCGGCRGRPEEEASQAQGIRVLVTM